MSLPKLSPLPDREANKLARFKLKSTWLEHESFKQDVYNWCKYGPSSEAIAAGKPTKEAFWFWGDHFCFIYDEEKPPEDRVADLIFWEFQRETLGEKVEMIAKVMEDPIARWNAGEDKARGMAATFGNLLLIQWFHQFWDISTIVTSKTDDDVDRQSDMNTPFERLRWQIEQQIVLFPFLFDDIAHQVLKVETDPKTGHAKVIIKDKSAYKTKLIKLNKNSQITGLPPTPKALRQGRALIWFGDEFAYVEKDYEVWEAAAGTVRVRLVCSTPKDPFCKYHRLIFQKDNEQMRVWRLEWWMRPDRAVGLYETESGEYSSPWFDAIKAANSKQVVAREYLLDHNEAIGGRVFYMFRAESKLPGLMPDRRESTIYRIWEPGLTFGVGWGQRDFYGNMLCLQELIMDVDDVQDIGDSLLNKIARTALKITEDRFNNFNIVDIGDPYGSRQQLASQEKGKTEFELLKERFGIHVQSRFIYDIPAHERESRGIEILGDLMSETCEQTAKPKILVCPVYCPTTVEAFEGAFKRKVNSDGSIEPKIPPGQHPFAEAADMWRYLALKLWDKRKEKQEQAAKPEKKQRTQWRRTMFNVRRSAGRGNRY